MQGVKTYTVEEAKRKLEAFCAYQERYHKEVVAKLRQMRMIPLAIDTIVVHLIENGFLNEERFAKSFARGKFRYKNWGKNRIKQELRFREISTYNIKIALQEIDYDEYVATFHKLAEKKYAEISEKNKLKAKKKLTDYLLYRGWESNWVYEKVSELFD
ncbi:regulatory protein RecX [Capnocytophaga canimorsus]|uniref:regulatory protein RecX n=1 Tax=Capnocytophaga canimorsus TaxID=28188 RepID=UPI0037D6E4B0